MRMQRPAAAAHLALLVLLLAGPAQARESRAPVYLPDGSVDGASLIGPPPASGSAALREQMAIVMWLQRTRTPEQVAFVRRPLNLARFAPLLGDALLGVDGLALRAVLGGVMDEVRDDYDALKERFALPRPFEANSAVRPATDARRVGSYPSGHATRATVYARLLGEIFPEHRDALAELGRQIGYGRVTAGVHYPIDVVAGQTLGQAYADAIAKGSVFQAAVTRIREGPPKSPAP